MSIEIWTDGGCRGNPGPGAWAYIISDGKTPPSIISEKCGCEKETTNNRMELSAVIAALETLDAGSRAAIYTDSEYVKNGITVWIHNWKIKNWRTSGKQPVKNRDLWQRLDGLSSLHNLSWNWVKGHAGAELNERCDKLVREAVASIES